MKDVYGKGLLAYCRGNEEACFTVESDIAETEEWPVSVFFREYDFMPEVERLALSRVQGSVLDVGAGAGSHALWLQQQGKDVTAMDLSEGAVQVMRERGVERVFQQDFFQLSGQQYDTLLLLMNGAGIAGKLKHLPQFLEQAKSLLRPGGKILMDSSDVKYLFEDEDEDGEGDVYYDFEDTYYGELSYTFGFEGESGEPFDWFFVDFDTLAEYAERAGFSCKKVYEDEHYLYLVELVYLPPTPSR